jgi:hypothetical protein
MLAGAAAASLSLISLRAEDRWQLASESGKVELGNGAWQVTRKLTGPAELEISLVFFNQKQTKAGVVAQTAARRFEAKTLAQLADGEGAVAACNGGYFTPTFGPDGLEIAQGLRTGAWRKDLPFGGVLFVKDSVLSLESDRKFQLDESVTQLVQCCPMLVMAGKALRGIGGADLVARTFVATDGADGWLIGYSARAALEVLGDSLVAPEVVREFRVQSAMNLDGGPSSGLWWKPRTGAAQGIRETTRVRNVIVVLPK